MQLSAEFAKKTRAISYEYMLSISIMSDMAQKGELNEKIVHDIDGVMAISRQDNVSD